MNKGQSKWGSAENRVKNFEIWWLAKATQPGLAGLHTICPTVESKGKTYSLYKKSFLIMFT